MLAGYSAVQAIVSERTAARIMGGHVLAWEVSGRLTAGLLAPFSKENENFCPVQGTELP